MGVSIYPVLENDSSELTTQMCGKSLAHHEDELSKHAKKSGCTALMDFYVPDEEDLEEFGIEPDGSPDWFTPKDGLKTIATMHAHASAHPSEFTRLEGLLEDLEDFQKILTLASEKSLRWHLAMDY